MGVMLVGILVLCPALACSETETMPEEINRPEWEIGDEWEHQVFLVLKSGKEEKGPTRLLKVIEKEDFEGTMCYVLAESIKSLSRSYYTLDLNRKGFVNKVDSKVLSKAKYTPDTMELSWPLRVGKKWEQSYTGVIESRSNGGRGKLKKREVTVKATLEVVGMEKVKVPAGEFVTFKIVKRIDDVVVEEYWYSPEVKWLVRTKVYYQNDDPKAPKAGVLELTKYKVKN